MSKSQLKTFFGKAINPTLIIGLAIIARLVPHIPNFTPIAAMALFGGVYLNRRYAILVPLAAMAFSDVFIGFYSPVVMVFVYGSFVLTGLIGLWLKKRKSPGNVIFAAVGASMLFFLITNFAVWLGGWYPRSIAGLIESYTLALPFFRNTLAGNLFYTGVFFGGYELVLKLVRKPVLATVEK
jgi:hypothetical protein